MSDGDKQDPHLEEFVRMLTGHQVDLQAFIMSSLGNYSDAADVLQAANVALWKKAAQFRPGAAFLPWAFQVAKFEILAFVRSRRRERLVFSPELVEMMIPVAVERSSGFPSRGDALRECIKRLSERNREFLRIRYAQEQSIQQISEKTGRSLEAVKSLYHRIRKSIERCIDRKVASDTL
jgi:RNA polymerase sigma-70 factor (ECF subfamily)